MLSGKIHTTRKVDLESELLVQSCARSSASLSILSSLSIRTIRCSVVSVSGLVIEVRKQAAVAAGVTVFGLVVVVRKRTGRTTNTSSKACREVGRRDKHGQPPDHPSGTTGVIIFVLVVVVRKRTGRTNIHIFESIYLGARAGFHPRVR